MAWCRCLRISVYSNGSESLLCMDRLTPLTDFKTIRPHFLLDNEKLITFSPTEQLICSLSTQRVST